MTQILGPQVEGPGFPRRAAKSGQAGLAVDSDRPAHTKTLGACRVSYPEIAMSRLVKAMLVVLAGAVAASAQCSTLCALCLCAHAAHHADTAAPHGCHHKSDSGKPPHSDSSCQHPPCLSDSGRRMAPLLLSHPALDPVLAVNAGPVLEVPVPRTLVADTSPPHTSLGSSTIVVLRI